MQRLGAGCVVEDEEVIRTVFKMPAKQVAHDLQGSIRGKLSPMRRARAA